MLWLKWSKLCCSKYNGSIAFRRLTDSNPNTAEKATIPLAPTDEAVDKSCKYSLSCTSIRKLTTSSRLEILQKLQNKVVRYIFLERVLKRGPVNLKHYQGRWEKFKKFLRSKSKGRLSFLLVFLDKRNFKRMRQKWRTFIGDGDGDGESWICMMIQLLVKDKCTTLALFYRGNVLQKCIVTKKM